MAHYAFLDKNNVVTEVIVGRGERETTDGVLDWETYYGLIRGQKCFRTSYNTFGGEHLAGGTPFRKNYAGVGCTYDEERDAFIPPQPFNSWILNEDTCLWESSVPYPSDSDGIYQWDEPSINWILVQP